jgi:hypothetical protein
MPSPLIEVLRRHTTRTKKLITGQLDAAAAYHRFPPTSANGLAFLLRWTRNAVTGVSGGRFRPVKFVTPFPREAVQIMCFIQSSELNQLTVPL